MAKKAVNVKGKGKKAPAKTKSAPKKSAANKKNKPAPAKKAVGKTAAKARNVKKKTEPKSTPRKSPAAAKSKPAKAIRTATPNKKPGKHNKRSLSRNIPQFKGVQKKHYESLMQARNILMEQIQFHTDEALNYSKNSSAERSGISTHMADQGSDNFIHDMELGLLTSEGEALEMIEEAILRLIDGEYGKCLDCGCKIHKERLEAKPYARFCVKCKSIREENGETSLG